MLVGTVLYAVASLVILVFLIRCSFTRVVNDFGNTRTENDTFYACKTHPSTVSSPEKVPRSLLSVVARLEHQ